MGGVGQGRAGDLSLVLRHWPAGKPTHHRSMHTRCRILSLESTRKRLAAGLHLDLG